MEDNLELSWILADCLKNEGFETQIAANGSAGVKGALSYLPDLVLLDYNLGDMTGHDVAVAIRNMRKTSKIPFIVLSAIGADPMLVRGFTKFPNCRGTLAKTHSTKEIIKAIRLALPARPK
ncbi:MAG: response regulator [Elusimicrobiota bacterium]|nr:response regulator [Elusimicrobiota bacterium]